MRLPPARKPLTRKPWPCPPFTTAVVCCASAAPVLSPYGDFKWYITAAFVCLAIYRICLPAPVPVAFRLMSAGFVLGILPFVWTGNLEDLRLPLTEAAFFYTAGGCGFEFEDPRSARRARLVVLAVAAVTALQAVGVMTRYGQDPFSTVRISWNLTGLLFAVAAVGAVGCLPGIVSAAMAVASVALVAVSGSRNAMLFTLMGVLLVIAFSRGASRRLILLYGLCAAFGIGSVLLSRLLPNVISDPVVAMRIARSVTFQDADRAESWSFWLDKCMERPNGGGMSTTGQDVMAQIGSHNGWLDLWGRGGLLCAAVFTFGQVVFLIALLRVDSRREWRALAIALAAAASCRMVFEVLPLATSYGMNGLLVLLVGGMALSCRPSPLPDIDRIMALKLFYRRGPTVAGRISHLPQATYGCVGRHENTRPMPASTPGN